MRIIDRLNVGGPARHVTWLTAGLEAEGFETALVTGAVAAGEGDMGYVAKQAGIRPIVIPEMSRELSLRDLMVIAKLLRLMLSFEPDIIHTHKAKAGAVGRVAAMIYKWMTPSALWLRPRRVRVVHTFHGHIFHSYYGAMKTRVFITIERMLARFTDVIVSVSEQQRQEISGRFRVGRPEQFRVVRLGTDATSRQLVGQSLRSQPGLKQGEVLVGAVGRLCEIKNYEMLLEAAARLASDVVGSGEELHAGPNSDRTSCDGTDLCNSQTGQECTSQSAPAARFVLIGDGHLRPSLERRAAELGLGGSVTFTGFREDVTSLYETLDLVALTSLNEGTPLTLIEAMSHGRPVVATEVGGVIDLMGERRQQPGGFTVWDHGVTVPSRDVVALESAIRFLIERPELRAEMGERGRRFAVEQFSVERLIRDMAELYRDLIGRHVAELKQPSQGRLRKARIQETTKFGG
jgi:glycosyltransferase involved in cell wall biosynthesis